MWSDKGQKRFGCLPIFVIGRVKQSAGILLVLFLALQLQSCGYSLGALTTTPEHGWCIEAGAVGSSTMTGARELRIRTSLIQALAAQSCSGVPVRVTVQSISASRTVASYDKILVPVFYRWQLTIRWKVGSTAAHRTLVTKVFRDVPYLTDARTNEELDTVYLERMTIDAVKDLSLQLLALENEYAVDLT